MLGGPAIWFTVFENGADGLVNGLEEVTIRLVTFAIWFTELAMQENSNHAHIC